MILLSGCSNVNIYHHDCHINGMSLKETQIQFQEWFNVSSNDAEKLWSSVEFQNLLNEMTRRGICRWKI